MICSKCKKEKQLEEFPIRTNTKLGRRRVCKKCFNAYHRQWWKRTAPIRLEYAQKWYANNREKIIQQKIASNLKRRRLARLDCIAHYSNGKNCCECCGEKNLEFLAIDHIKGGGNKYRKTNKEYLPLILKRDNFPKGHRVLCHNCNLSLGFYGYCPHQKKRNTK